MFSAKALTKQSGKVKRVHQCVHHPLFILQTVYMLLRKMIPLYSLTTPRLE